MKHPDLGERLAAGMAAAADAIAALQTIDAPLDWVDEVIDADGDAIKTDEAAYIAAVSADTIRRRADAAAAAGKPFGILMAGALWLFSEEITNSAVAAARIDRNHDGDRGLGVASLRNQEHINHQQGAHRHHGNFSEKKSDAEVDRRSQGACNPQYAAERQTRRRAGVV